MRTPITRPRKCALAVRIRMTAIEIMARLCENPASIRHAVAAGMVFICTNTRSVAYHYRGGADHQPRNADAADQAQENRADQRTNRETRRQIAEPGLVGAVDLPRDIGQQSVGQ